MLDLPTAETISEPLIGHHSHDDQPATWKQVDYIRPIPLWKGQCFVLTVVDNYSGYRLAFPAHNASAKTTIIPLNQLLGSRGRQIVMNSRPFWSREKPKSENTDQRTR